MNQNRNSRSATRRHRRAVRGLPGRGRRRTWAARTQAGGARAAGAVAAVLCLAALCLAAGAAGQFRPPSKASLEAVADRASYAPGDQVRLAAVVTIDDGWHIQSHTPSFEYLIPTEIAFEAPADWPEPVLAYPAHVMWQSQFEADPLAVYEHEATIHAAFDVPASAMPGVVEIPVELVYQACDDTTCLPPTTAEATVSITIGETGEATGHPAFGSAGAAGSGGAPDSSGAAGLLTFLIPALLGGLILNGMPCVLPIVSLKLFGLAEVSGQTRRQITMSALATTLGILVSFWALAGATILARSAGQAIGWGIQFQNPMFVAFLALVLTLFSLNIWGLFEIRLPHAIANRLGGGQREGYSGHFFSGVFATLMATPCSAPFLGAAIGFALSQPGTVIVAVFTAVGVGLATPYLLLAAAPGVSRLLPEPGEWMDTLRGVMGFLIAGTTVWLLYVLAAQMDSARLALLEIGLLAVALCIWLQGRALLALPRILGRVGAAAAAVFVLVLAGGAAAGRTVNADAGPGFARVLDWVPFDPVQAETLAREGRLVFVDVTADWCATCKVNERLVLETEAIAALFDRYDVVAMQADWTNRNDGIARYLASFGRYGIPFYVLYGPNGPPHVFGELLRAGTLEEAVRNAASDGVAARQELAPKRNAAKQVAAERASALADSRRLAMAR